MKKFKLLIFVLVSVLGFSQNTYIDPTTTLALKLYSDNLEKQQQKTVDEQKKLQKAQAWVATQMAVANNIQEKVLTGLREVSGTLQNGIQIKNIGQNPLKIIEQTMKDKNISFEELINYKNQEYEKI